MTQGTFVDALVAALLCATLVGTPGCIAVSMTNSAREQQAEAVQRCRKAGPPGATCRENVNAIRRATALGMAFDLAILVVISFAAVASYPGGS